MCMKTLQRNHCDISHMSKAFVRIQMYNFHLAAIDLPRSISSEMKKKKNWKKSI